MQLLKAVAHDFRDELERLLEGGALNIHCEELVRATERGEPDLSGLFRYGKERLPRLAIGSAIVCYALTEESAGSDAAALHTGVTRQGECYLLNGTKRYITNAPVADLFTVFAAHPGTGTKPKISAFVVEKGTPGLRIGKTIRMAGGNGAFHSEVLFANLAVPAENRLGEEGDGFAIAIQCLDAGRINWPAYCIGAAQRLLDMTTAHMQSGRQFGKPLADNQGTVDAGRRGGRTACGSARLLRSCMAL